MIGARAGHAALRQSDRGLARRRLRVSAAREGRGRSSDDAHRRARDRGPDQGARGGAPHLRGREGRGPQGDARRAGAAEHVHDERREHRAERGDRRRARIPGDAALRRRLVPRCASRWPSRRATSPARRSPSSRPRGMGRIRPRDTMQCPTPTASPRPSSSGATGHVNPVIDRRRPRTPAFRSRKRHEPLSRDGRRGAPGQPLSPDARRRRSSRPRATSSWSGRPTSAARPAPRSSPRRRAAASLRAC